MFSVVLPHLAVDARRVGEGPVGLDQPLGVDARQPLQRVHILRVAAQQLPALLQQADEVVRRRGLEVAWPRGLSRTGRRGKTAISATKKEGQFMFVL